jgi:uncharacterized membrane protein
VEITTIMGVPAHPLMVHVPVVLVPLSLVSALLMFIPRWRERIGWVTVVLAGVALVFTQLAISSGEGLEDHVERSRYLEDHTSIAENLRPWVFLFFLGLLAVMLIDRSLRRRAAAGGGTPAGNPRAALAALVVTALLGVGASFVTYRVGHTGAKASWHEVNLKSGGGEG